MAVGSAQMQAFIVPQSRRMAVRRRVSTPQMPGMSAFCRYAPSVPSMRKLEGVSHSSRMTQPKAWTPSLSKSAVIRPQFPTDGKVNSTSCP